MTIFFGNSSGNLMADRRYEIALQLAKEGDFMAAADLLRQGIELSPGWPPLHFHLGEACHRIGHMDEAKAALKDYLTLDPDDKMGATIKLALLGATPAPPSLPAGYVRSLFDQYAPQFEKSLIEQLAYQAPDYIFQDVIAIDAGPFENVLDLGCGTGLAAQIFDERGKRYTGIDISPRMVEIAKAKNIYSALHVGDINKFLEASGDHFDLVLSADVFVYVGALEKTLALVADHLQQRGIFAFSVQTLEKGDFTLGKDHRYAHSRSYIETCALNAGLEIVSCRDAILRRDGSEFIQGMIFVYRKP